MNRMHFLVVGIFLGSASSFHLNVCCILSSKGFGWRAPLRTSLFGSTDIFGRSRQSQTISILSRRVCYVMVTYFRMEEEAENEGNTSSEELR